MREAADRRGELQSPDVGAPRQHQGFDGRKCREVQVVDVRDDVDLKAERLEHRTGPADAFEGARMAADSVVNRFGAVEAQGDAADADVHDAAGDGFIDRQAVADQRRADAELHQLAGDGVPVGSKQRLSTGQHDLLTPEGLQLAAGVSRLVKRQLGAARPPLAEVGRAVQASHVAAGGELPDAGLRPEVDGVDDVAHRPLQHPRSRHAETVSAGVDARIRKQRRCRLRRRRTPLCRQGPVRASSPARRP